MSLGSPVVAAEGKLDAHLARQVRLGPFGVVAEVGVGVVGVVVEGAIWACGGGLLVSVAAERLFVEIVASVQACMSIYQSINQSINLWNLYHLICCYYSYSRFLERFLLLFVKLL